MHGKCNYRWKYGAGYFHLNDLSAMIKLALADDQFLFRRGMAMLLRDMSDVQVVFECSNGEELLTGLKGNTIDIVLLDLEMPVMDGMETMKRLRAEHPAGESDRAEHARRGEVHRAPDGAGRERLRAEDRRTRRDRERRASVATSGYHFSEMVSRVMLHGLVKKEKLKPTFSDVDPLTERELEVLRLICQELTTTEIAGKLFLSPRTVEGHRNNILLKTGARNTAGIVVYAMSKGIYAP